MAVTSGEPKRGVVAFTLYRDEELFNIGAARQIERFNRYSSRGPVQWNVHIYAGDSIPSHHRNKLEDLGARIFSMRNHPEDRTASFWRHHAFQSDFDYYLCRDIDARLGPREQAAIDEFVESGADYHFMRDHPSHVAPILPGLWGCTRRGRDRIVQLLPTLPPERFFEWVNRRLGSDHLSNDFPFAHEIWLWRHVWPRARGRALIHSELSVSRFHGSYITHPFPTPRGQLEFVGKAYDAAERDRWPQMAHDADRMAWFEKRRATPILPKKPAQKICVKLACGFGNNLFQIIAGMALAKRLTERSGVVHPCEIIIPDPVDFARSYSICETLGGHLRADRHYRREHMDYGLPDAGDLPNILPALSWRNIASPRPQYTGDLSELVSAKYFETNRYFEIQGDESYLADHQTGHFRVVNCHFVPSFYPFPAQYWFPELLTFRTAFEPGAGIARYLHHRYGYDCTNPPELIGVHIRNDQRIADIHRSDSVPLSWYIDCVGEAVKAAGQGAHILIVSNAVSGNNNSGSVLNRLVAALSRSYPHNRLIVSTREVWYVDYFLLRLCTELVVSCSTFGFAAGLTSTRLRTMYVPNTFAGRHFMGDDFPEFCAFVPDRQPLSAIEADGHQAANDQGRESDR